MNESSGQGDSRKRSRGVLTAVRLAGLALVLVTGVAHAVERPSAGQGPDQTRQSLELAPMAGCHYPFG